MATPEHAEVKTLLAAVKADGGPNRARMPQLSGVPEPGSKADAIPHGPGQEVDLTNEFEKELRSLGVSVDETTVRAEDLKPTQDQLIVSKVEGVAQFMRTAPANSPVFEPVFVTRDNYVIDGHHRWAAHMVRDRVDGSERPMRVRQVGLDREDVLPIAVQFMREWGLPFAGMKDHTTIPKFANLATVDGMYGLVDLAITPGGRVGDASPLGKGKRKLSDYEREIAHALIRKGKSKRAAIKMARGLLRNAAATGRWAGRGRASGPVRAGAAASIAQRKTF